MIYRHIPNTKVSAVFTRDRKYRYRLDVELSQAPENAKTACVIMMNPSYANEEIADRSVQFMERVVLQRGLPEFQGVGKLIVVNQFAFIQTHQFTGQAHEVGAKNDAAIQKAFYEADIIIVGWGCANPFEGRKRKILSFLKKHQHKKIYRTKKHPSRAGYAGFILPFHWQDGE